jgi:hypothetical protein
VTEHIRCSDARILTRKLRSTVRQEGFTLDTDLRYREQGGAWHSWEWQFQNRYTLRSITSELAAKGIYDQSKQLARRDGFAERTGFFSSLGTRRALFRLEATVVVNERHGFVLFL